MRQTGRFSRYIGVDYSSAAGATLSRKEASMIRSYAKGGKTEGTGCRPLDKLGVPSGAEGL